MLGMQAHRVRRAAEALCQQGKIATVLYAATDLRVLAGCVGSRGLPRAEQRSAPSPDPVRRATEALREYRCRQAGRGHGPEQGVVRGRPDPGATGTNPQGSTASNDGVNGAAEPARDLGDRLPVGVQPAQ